MLVQKTTIKARPIPSDAANGAKRLAERRRVLAADTPEGIATMRKILEPMLEVVPASSMADALELLEGKVDLMVCGIHFEDCRMIDLLRLAKADPLSRDKPILCYRDHASELPTTIFQSLSISCKALGAADFVDLHALKQEVGVMSADARFLAIVLRHLGHGDV